jgi:hypothetical protein
LRALTEDDSIDSSAAAGEHNTPVVLSGVRIFCIHALSFPSPGRADTYNRQNTALSSVLLSLNPTLVNHHEGFECSYRLASAIDLRVIVYDKPIQSTIWRYFHPKDFSP